MSRRLIVVSNRLPFQLKKENGTLTLRQSDGGLVSSLLSYFEHDDADAKFDSVVWIGSADFNEKTWVKLDKKELKFLRYEVVPLFFERKIYDQFYNGFCNATLWPLFHYFPSLVEFNGETFTSYEQVNQKFSEQILSIAQPNDYIWIHDYQLMLVPGMLRTANKILTIGFFLHIPFPSYEVFRLLHRSWKEKLIEGLLGADLIGFHTHEYVQHFLKTVRMIKGYDHQFRDVQLPGRTVKAEMFPLGIDFAKFNNAVHLPEVQEQSERIRKNFPGKKIIFSVDRLDYTKGITHRLRGFEKFMDQRQEWKEHVVFILVVLPSRQIVSKYNERKKLIEEEIGRINGKYSTLQWQPIIYRYNTLSFHELTAMYSIADVGLITPLRDGMNLVAKEYVACKDKTGVLVLSELAGAASELSEALLVNPMDEEEVSSAIHAALSMSADLQAQKLEMLQNRLKEYTVTDWMGDFMRQLEVVKGVQRSQASNVLSSDSIMKMRTRYEAAQCKLFLLDYDGTLVPFSKHPSLAIPDLNLLVMLNQILGDPTNDVAIISGRDKDSLQKWFGHLAITIVSEHGASIRLKGEVWKNYVHIEHDWKSIIRPVLNVFVKRSPGAFIEEKAHTLVWHYRNVDSELGFIRSRELLDNLYHLIRNSPLNILDGNHVIEIRVNGIDKGAVTKKLLAKREYDFVLAIGDDKTDEDMFKVIADKGYSIKIGMGTTAATFQVADQRDVIPFLAEFVPELDTIKVEG